MSNFITRCLDLIDDKLFTPRRWLKGCLSVGQQITRQTQFVRRNETSGLGQPEALSPSQSLSLSLTLPLIPILNLNPIQTYISSHIDAPHTQSKSILSQIIIFIMPQFLNDETFPESLTNSYILTSYTNL